MKIFKKLCVLFVFFFQLNLIQSQNSLEIEANYALTSEKLVSHNKIDFYDSEIFHSVGFNVRKIFESRVFIKGGLQFKNFGAKFTDVQISGQTTESIEIKYSAKGIDIPFGLGYYFINHQKLRFGGKRGA